jgi:hypothetical protein
MATFEECAAAAEAVGWDVTSDEVAEAMTRHGSSSLDTLRKCLEDRETVFDANGARGVELADQIDSLRIAIAVREYREANG